MMTTPHSERELISTRLEEAGREIGVLLIAFAPLDLAFAGGAGRIGFAALFFLIGTLCFIGALQIERRRTRRA